MQQIKRLVALFVVVSGLSALSVSRASADWCTYCRVQGGCWVHEADGWITCTNIPGGCILEGGCTETFASGGFALDGTRLTATGPSSGESATVVGGTEPKPTSLGRAVSVDLIPDILGSATYLRSPCDQSIVARAYPADVARGLRANTRNILL